VTAVARVTVAAVLVCAAALVMLWAGTRPSGAAEVVRLVVMAAAVGAVAAGLCALPKGDGDG
jgi:hypothetical protein